MKEGLFILALLIVSSYAIDIRHPGAASHPEHKTLKPAATPIPKQSPAAHPQAQFRAAKLQARKKTALTAHEQGKVSAAAAAHAAAQTHHAAAAHVEVAHQVHQLNTTNVTAPAHVKRTPGAPCATYTTCVECTDDDSKAFYCMWSAARNVCQEDTDMDKLKRANPEDLWTKQCAPKEPLPIVDCNGCPINNPLDKKPERDIVDAKNKGSDGHEVSAVEGSLKLLGTDPNDPVTGPITHPNGTNGPQYLLPSIRDEDGNIKDPVQDPEKLTYSPCVGDANCAASSRFVSSTRKGKFAPDLLSDDDSSANANAQTDEPRMQQNRHVPHVDKVEMQEAAMEDEPKDDDDTNAKTAATDSSELEVSSRVVKDADAATPAPGGGFTPAFSDDDTPSTDAAAVPAPAAASSSSTDEPRFKQTTGSKHSEFKGMSAGKAATQSKESTMEVTEFDDNVVGGKKINEDDDAKPTKEEADSKQ